ncbi:MAG TPA: N,N-dimethylformamidase beta subunit family domain-containing protein, partial [Acidimicrobiales bacterium]|nr:N,N-dimethylformamidase beta subunit family domain-containing protein [Acidimicrobiales bacterium]
MPDRPQLTRRALLFGALGTGGLGVLRALGILKEDAAPSAAAPTTTTTASSTPITRAKRARAKPIADTRNIIQIENAKPGTTDFGFPFEDDVQSRIAGYANRDSARRGDNVRLFVSTTGSTFTVEAFRFGHYGGAGARKVWQTERPVVGGVQAPPVVHFDTNMRECEWLPSVDVTVGEDWTPGMYLFRLKSDDGGGHFVPLVVLDDRKADLLVISAITTWNAYNTYGGASLYEGDIGRSQLVSFDRPGDANGSGHFFGGEREFVQQAESMGIDVTYTTDVDLHARPDQTTTRGYKA